MNDFEKMSKILDKERDCLVSGNFSRLEELIAIKEELAIGLSNRQIDEKKFEVNGIRRKLLRNGALLESAQRGIKSAMLQLKEMSDDTFQSYTKEGARSPLSKSMTLRQKI